MSELKLSITILVSYVIALLGIANIDRFQENVLDLAPAFFIIVAVVVFSELILVGILIRSGVKINSYAVMAFWVFVYILVSVIFHDEAIQPIEYIVQVLLIILSSFLAYDVGRRIGELDKTLEGLSSSAYPNRVRDIYSSRDLISAEITRSRRYHHPLSVLTIRLEKPNDKQSWKELDSLANDMIERFAIAKASQILSDMARSTDVILQDRDGQFVLLCPETNLTNATIVAERMEAAVAAGLNAKIEWGSAAFPDEALTFEDLIHVARNRTNKPELTS